jgi:peptide/nickel transport system permease protein
MWSYVLRRLFLAISITLGVTLVTFLLTRVVPSNPAILWCGRFATAEQIAQIEERLGLDEPWHVQYLKYLRELSKGNLGVSLRTHRPVKEELIERLPASLELIIVGMSLGLIAGISLGIAAALKPHFKLDYMIRIMSVSGVALPQFWLAMILQLVFGVYLGLLPLASRMGLEIQLMAPFPHVTGFYIIDSLIAGEWQALGSALLHIILPAVCLAAYVLGMSARLVRAELLEILNEDYITTARACGVREYKILAKYALRNAIAPVMTMSALSFVYTLVGTFMVESIFAWPGIGWYTAKALLSNDISVVMGTTLLVAISTVFFNLLVDLSLAWLDPRIQLG